MKAKFFKLAYIIFLSFTLFCTNNITVFAVSDSGHIASGGGYGSGLIDGFNDWSNSDKFKFYKNNLPILATQWFGFIVNGAMGGASAWNEEYIRDNIQLYITNEKLETEGCATYEDYIAKHLRVNDNNELVADDEVVDITYQLAVDFIEEETGYYVHKTAESNRVTSYYVNDFETSTQYVALRDYINSNPDKVFLIPRFGSSTVFIYDENGNDTGERIQGIMFYMFDISEFDFVVSKSTYEMYNVSIYDKNWEVKNYPRYIIDLGGTVRCAYTYESLYRSALTGIHPYASQGDKYYAYKHEGYTSSMTIDGLPVWAIDSAFYVTSSGQSLRMYKSLADLKQYSVGQRPYYITDKFQDYDINGDNSCIVTESDLSNGSVYGDVYNYIINNYDNPDGLTEDELRDILNDYFGQGSGGSGSGSGSGDSSGSGSSSGGLSGFLSGLGSLGDAILGILGKLIEYIGKAIDLITNGLTGIIDKIPKGVTDFMSAIFPFMPEEFFTALTLAMVLGVVCIVIKIFK